MAFVNSGSGGRGKPFEQRGGGGRRRGTAAGEPQDGRPGTEPRRIRLPRRRGDAGAGARRDVAVGARR